MSFSERIVLVCVFVFGTLFQLTRGGCLIEQCTGATNDEAKKSCSSHGLELYNTKHLVQDANGLQTVTRELIRRHETLWMPKESKSCFVMQVVNITSFGHKQVPCEDSFHYVCFNKEGDCNNILCTTPQTTQPTTSHSSTTTKKRADRLQQRDETNEQVKELTITILSIFAVVALLILFGGIVACKLRIIRPDTRKRRRNHPRRSSRIIIV